MIYAHFYIKIQFRYQPAVQDSTTRCWMKLKLHTAELECLFHLPPARGVE